MPQRTRTRSQKQYGMEIQKLLSTGQLFYIPWSYVCEHETITDTNNGRTRPDSSVIHKKSKCVLVPYEEQKNIGYGTVSWGSTQNRPSNFVADTIYNLVVAPMQASFENSLKKKAYHHFTALQERWSSINFLAELGDVTSMFKRLDKYRYTDWAFGIKPFLDDCAEINQRLRTTKEMLNAKLANMRDQSHKPYAYTKTSFVSGNERWSFFVNDSSDVEFYVRVTSRFKGEASVLLPVIGISSDNDEDILLDQMMLDNQGFHPDLATIWEAVPFSWLVDWVLPVGQSLEALSGSWFNPTVYLRGNISTRVVGSFSCKNANVADGPLRYGKTTVSDGVMDYYFRSPYSLGVDNRSISLPQVQIPKINLSRSLILQDVFGSGTSVEDVIGKFRGKRR